MLSNSQKEHLTYTAIGQIFTLIAIALFSQQYIIPGISALSKQEDTAQVAIDKYETTLEKGISYVDLSGLLTKKADRAELIKIIQSDPNSAEDIIKKPTAVEKRYSEWLK